MPAAEPRKIAADATTPPKPALPRGRQPASYDDAALRSHLQKQWDAPDRRVPTYAELQRGDPDNPDVPRFGGSLTRLVRLRRAFLAEVDPTSAAAGQHRLSRVEQAVEKNTVRTDHVAEALEGAALSQAVDDLRALADSLRLQINARDVRTETLGREVTSLRDALSSLLQGFARWQRGQSVAPADEPVAKAALAQTPPESVSPAPDTGAIQRLLDDLLTGQKALAETVGTVIDNQTQLGSAIGQVRNIASERHTALNMVTERLESAANDLAPKMKAAPSSEEMAAEADADKAYGTELLASIEGRLQSIDGSFQRLLEQGGLARGEAASVAREVADKACVELDTASIALRSSEGRMLKVLGKALSHLAESQIAQVDVMEAQTNVVLEALERTSQMRWMKSAHKQRPSTSRRPVRARAKRAKPASRPKRRSRR